MSSTNNSNRLFLLTQLAGSLVLAQGFSSSSSVERVVSPKDISSRILADLRNTSAQKKILNLETDFFDQGTGLYSEGVWHNALVGIASIQNNEPVDQIAKALFDYAWDGYSFQRRSWSGNWDHSTIKSDNPPEQANYYRESTEHRCVQHGMALIFWSRLLLRSSTANQNVVSNTSLKYQCQQKLIADCFIREFWDPSMKRWTTVSQRQGGGDVLRPSASAAKQTLGISVATPYYRAVDQAIAVLACLEHLETLEQNRESDAPQIKQEELLVDVIQTTCHQILSPNGFGYVNIKDAKSYIGLSRNRNFWHDGWTFLALIKARQYVWSSNTNYGEAELVRIWQGLVDMYGHGSAAGTVWHWPTELKDDSSNVRYCGDNVLAFAIRRNLNPKNSLEAEEGFWSFIKDLQKQNYGNLVSVADVYPQVRLHPNTELAALLVWP